MMARFVALEFDYPSADLEANIIVKETGIEHKGAVKLVKFAAYVWAGQLYRH